MIVERTYGDDMLLVLWLTKQEFQSLEDALEPIERFTWHEGKWGDYRNLFIPGSRILFVYEGEPKKDDQAPPQGEPSGGDQEA